MKPERTKSALVLVYPAREAEYSGNGSHCVVMLWISTTCMTAAKRRPLTAGSTGRRAAGGRDCIRMERDWKGEKSGRNIADDGEGRNRNFLRHESANAAENGLVSVWRGDQAAPGRARSARYQGHASRR